MTTTEQNKFVNRAATWSCAIKEVQALIREYVLL